MLPLSMLPLFSLRFFAAITLRFRLRHITRCRSADDTPLPPILRH